MTTVVVLPEAEIDLLEAQLWLTENASTEVALSLGEEFRSITKRIAELPESFPVRENATARVAVLDGFQFSLYFDLDLVADRASVIAMIHHARSPRLVEDRL